MILKTNGYQIEVWKDIEGQEGVYQVSNKGRIKSFTRRVPFIRLGKPQTFIVKGQIMTPIIDPHGYQRIMFKRRGYFIHRLVAQAFTPNPKNKPWINHKDFNPLNNHIENLEWVTAQENTNHMIKGGRFNKVRKFTNEQILEIRRLYKKGVRGSGSLALSKKYGCNDKTIYKIVTWQTYKHF